MQANAIAILLSSMLLLALQHRHIAPHSQLLLEGYDSVSFAEIGQVPDEQRLYRDLMDGYEASIRPVLNSSQRVTVQFDLALKQIVGLVRENLSI